MGFTKVATTTASSSVASADKVSSANLNPTKYRNRQCRSMGTTYTQVSGGTTTDYLINGVAFRAHTFTASGNLTVSTGKFMEFLIAGGGASGGRGQGSPFTEWGGGGGAGGLLYNQIVPFGPGTYAITIGAGGATPGTAPTDGAAGTSTTAFGLTALGGGGGGASSRNGTSGASGGGGSGRQDDGGGGSGASATQPTTFRGVFGGLTIQPGLGSSGGNVNGDGSNITGGGGGGGAGGVGGTGSSGTSAGAGGAGVASTITGTSYTYCGGGAGANSGSAATLYGQGGGGTHGGTNTSGFQGVVIVKYQL
jgi:hypothetical protein